MAKCSKCGSKPSSAFAKDSSKKSGLKSICRKCDNKARQGRREAKAIADLNSFFKFKKAKENIKPLNVGENVAQAKAVKSCWINTEERSDVQVPFPPIETNSQVVKYLIIPDTHTPYHDKKAWSLMLKSARELKPDVIITLGDFGDFYSVSSHDKNPNRIRMLDEELQQVHTCLDELDSLNAKEKVFIAGNHEDRLERYLMTKAPELFNLVKVEDLFKLKDRGWQYIPYKNHYKVGHIYITHDTGRAGRYAVYQSLADTGTNTIIGHTHRLAYMIEGNAEGKANVSTSFGWLGDFNKIDYMHRIRCLRDWALGFGIGYFDLKTSIMHLQPVPIVEYQCVVEGKLITLND